MNYVKKYFFLTLGSLIYALGISLFLDPFGLAPGGVTGLGVIFGYLANLPTGTVILFINIPILIFGLWKFGIKFLASTMYVTVVSSFMMNAIEDYLLPITGHISEDLLIDGIAGGAMMGFGMAVVFLNGGTTGGSDIIIKAVRQKVPHLKTGAIYMITDSFVVALSAIVFKNIELGLYAIITILVTNTVLDKFLYKDDGAQLLYVISDHSEGIAKRIMDEIDIGVTYLHGEGAYTGEDKKVLMVVARPNNYAKIRAIVREEDQDAFFIVSGANDVFGYGYKNHFMQEI